MQKSLKTLYPYLTIYTLLVFLFYSTGFNRNWPFWADQELSQTYAALLLNSGLGQGQELLSNPGFFSIHLMQLLVNFCNYLNFYQIETIDDLNYSPSIFKSMEYLVITARHFGLLTMIVFLSGLYFVTNKAMHNRFTALLFTLLIFASNGIFFHFTQTRTELITFIFLLSSIYVFTKAFNTKNNTAYLYLFFSIILFFCALLNKTQIIVFSPLYFACAYFFIKPLSVQSPAPSFAILMKVVGMMSILVGLFPFLIKSNSSSLLLNSVVIVSLNAIVFFLSVRTTKNPYLTMACFNTSYCICYFGLNWLTASMNQGISLFGLIDNPTNMVKFLNITQGGILPHGDANAGALTLSDPIKLLQFIFRPLVKMVFKMNSAFIFLLFIGLYLYKSFRTLSRQEIYFGVFCVASFYSINLINSIRGLTPYYVLFSEFFLVLYSFILIQKISLTRIRNRLIGLLIFLIVLINLVPYTDYYNYLIRKGNNPFCGEEISTLHLQISTERIEAACKETPL